MEEEEEQILDRLRRWYRDLRIRTVLGIPSSADAHKYLKRSSELRDPLGERVCAFLAAAGDQEAVQEAR